MTIEQIKELLPDVKVNILGTIGLAGVSGRLEKFATITMPMTGCSYQVSWDAIARAINANEAITA